MHRCYQPILPTHSKLLQARWDSAYYNEHRRKLAEARPSVDTRPPQTFMHLHLKLKKLQVEEERLATIERDNRILLEKMSYIMRTSGRVDNRNPYEYKSLNREKRMKELLSVAKENQHILRRITSRKPEYDHEKWEEDWETNQQFMDQISAYPRDWWKTQDRSGTSSRATGREKSSMSREKSTMNRQKTMHREKSTVDKSDDAKKSEKKRGRAESAKKESEDMGPIKESHEEEETKERKKEDE